ncbi:MAG: hypothetical protein M1835_007900 [Candelina submexicana]|nr:MAG: hypothetical protein M1835_007900 [Candelina submexicana]
MEAIAVVSLIATIASLTKVLSVGVNSLQSFLESSRVINQTLDSLYHESKVLLGTLHAISDALSNPKIQNSRLVQDHGDLWRYLTDSILDCDTTAIAINEEVKRVELRKPGLFTNQFRRYRFKAKEEEFSRLWSRVRTHGQVLLSCLGAINLINGVLSPDHIIDTLTTKINDLSTAASSIGDGTGSRPNLSRAERNELFRAAAKAGDTALVSSLIIQGVAVDQRDTSSGCTALHDACSNGHDETVSVLLTHADPNVVNEDWMTPLHYAARRGLDSIVNKLLNCPQINVDAVNDRAETALHFASYWNRPGCLKALLQAGADTNKKNKGGETALHLAAFGGKLGCVNALLQARADTDTKNKWGETALHLAASGGYADTVACLLEHADPNAQDDEGKTPLHLSAFEGHVSIVEQLLLRGADATIRSGYGQSPLDIANLKKFDSVAALLQGH